MDLNSWKPRLETCHWWFQRGSEPPCGLSRWPLWHWWVWASCLATDWQHGVDLRATDSEEVSVMKGLTLGPGLGAGRMEPHGEEEGVSTGEDVERLEPLGTAGGTCKGAAAVETTRGVHKN